MISLKKISARIKSFFKGIRKNQSVMNIAVLVAVLFIAVYVTVQLSSNVSTTVSTLRTQKMTVTESMNLKGYIFRDEQVCFEGEGKIADFVVRDGERVGKGQLVANVYRVADGYDADEVGEELLALTQRIRLVENGIEQAKHMSDASDITAEIDRSYYAFLSALEDANYLLSQKEESNFLDALNSYMVITGRTAEAESTLNSLVAQKQKLISEKTVGEAEPFYADESSCFYSQCDGYEQIFDYASVFSLTADGLEKMISTEKQSFGGAVGKKVVGSRWYIAFPVSSEQLEFFAENAEAGRLRYSATFTSNDDRTLDITFERACEGDSPFVVFSCKQSPENFEFSRAQNVQIQLGSVKGYRVPESAVFERDGVYFVYILNGNTVELRRITPIGQGAGYYIVKTVEADELDGSILNAATETESEAESESTPESESQSESQSEALTESESKTQTDTEAQQPLPNPAHRDVPYLELNDLIIISGNGLYDGKILK